LGVARLKQWVGHRLKAQPFTKKTVVADNSKAFAPACCQFGAKMDKGGKWWYILGRACK